MSDNPHEIHSEEENVEEVKLEEIPENENFGTSIWNKDSTRNGQRSNISYTLAERSGHSAGLLSIIKGSIVSASNPKKREDKGNRKL